MKRLMMYLKDYKKESILAPLFKLLEAFFELLVPLVMANIIDYGISNRNMGYIGKMGLLLLLLGVVGLASSITAQFFAAKAAVGFSTKLRQALFDHFVDMTFQDELSCARVILEECLKMENCTEIYVLGHSMGGAIASELAKLYPDVIKKMVLWAPAFNLPDALHYLTGQVERAKTYDHGGRSQFISPDIKMARRRQKQTHLR